MNRDQASSLDELYRIHSRRVLATLIRLLGDFDLAEEAMQEAFVAALRQWPDRGIPENPTAWLVSTGRFKAIDQLRKKARFRSALPSLALQEELIQQAPEMIDDVTLRDDQLRLIFTCCHPALSPETQVALTLREVCGLTTTEIASAFLTKESTVAQRIVRAKAKIRTARIPYQIPELPDLSERLEVVLHVIYFVFNEGYSASSGEALTRAELSNEAIRLGRLVLELLPDSEAMGLLALMILHEARRESRTTNEGEIVLLEDQDRSLWDLGLIQEGVELVRKALTTRNFGHFTIQAAIAALHAEAARPQDTDWAEIVGLYDLLLKADPSPVVELNRAVAVAMRDGPEAGMELIDSLFSRGVLSDYNMAHASKAELCRRLGRFPEAIDSFTKAKKLTPPGPLSRFLDRRIRELL